jgi:hypothetical protein
MHNLKFMNFFVNEEKACISSLLQVTLGRFRRRSRSILKGINNKLVELSLASRHRMKHLFHCLKAIEK